MNDKKQRFLELYLSKPSISSIAKEMNISRMTCYRYLRDDEVKTEIRDRKNQVINELLEYMQKNLQEATTTLMNIIKDKEAPQSVKVQAINSLFSNYKDMLEISYNNNEIDYIMELLKARDITTN